MKLLPLSLFVIITDIYLLKETNLDTGSLYQLSVLLHCSGLLCTFWVVSKGGFSYFVFDQVAVAVKIRPFYFNICL